MIRNKKLLFIILVGMSILFMASIGITIAITKNTDTKIWHQNETEIKIEVEEKERLENGFANILVRIQSNSEIENIVFQDADGTELIVETTKLTLAKDWQVEIGKEYVATVNTKDGTTKKEIIMVKRTIADVVKVGDFVEYSVGNWTKEDIEKVGTYYFGSSAPNTYEKFGGFGEGMSKDEVIEVNWNNGVKNLYSGGWRILSRNNDGTIKIIHAGTPEAYRIPRSMHNSNNLQNSIRILGTLRDFSMYEDCSTNSVNTNFSIEGSAHCVTDKEILAIGSTSDLRAIGVQYNYYYQISIGSPYWFLRSIGPQGHDWDTSLENIGIRPVVTLKAEIQATAKEGDTTHDTVETAWQLRLDE